MVFLFLASITIVVVDVDDCYYVPKFYFNRVSWIELCGTRYTSGDVVVATSDLLPQFGIIQEIIVHNLCYFLLKLLHTICFSTHFHSFEVINNSPPVFSVIKPSDLFDHCVLGLYHIQSHRSFLCHFNIF